MAFDAGTIIAHLDLDDDAFARKLAEDVAKVEAAERATHEIKIVPQVDQSAEGHIRNEMRRIDQGVTRDAESRLRGGQGSLLGMLHGLFSGRGLPGISQSVGRNLVAALSTAGPTGTGAAASTASAAGPGMGLLAARPAAMVGLGGIGLAALPALAGVAGTGLGGMVGLGGAGFLGMQAVSQNLGPALQAYQQAQVAMQMAVTPQQRLRARQQMAGAQQFARAAPPGGLSVFRSISGLQDAWQNFTGTLLPALARPLRQIVPMVESLFGPLRRFFTDAMTVVVPFVRVLTTGVKEILPLLGSLARASGPGFAQLTSGLLMLVRNILPGLTTLVRATAPYMSMFARSLATVGRDLGRMFAAMAPAVGPSMRILTTVLNAVGGLLPVIGRLAAIFARMLLPVVGQIATAFKLLEPAILAIARPLGALAGAVLQDLGAALVAIAKLLGGLAPSFTLIGGLLLRVFGSLESAGVFGALASALEQLAGPLAQLINLLVRQLMPVAGPLVTMFVRLTDVMIILAAAGLGTVIKLVVLLLQHMPFLVPIVGAVIAAWAALNLAFTITPIGAIIVGIVALIGALTLLVTHWHQVWGFIERIAAEAWHFIVDGWGKFLLPMLGPVGLIALGAIELYKHWDQVWGWIRNTAADAWHFLHDDVFAPLVNFVTGNIPDAFSTAAKWIGQRWDSIKGIIRDPVAWVIDNVLDGLISAFDWITSKLGLGKPIGAVHPMGLARGGRIPGYGGGDRHPALLESGETVVSKEHSGVLADIFSAIGVPGYQQGGVIPHAGLPRYGQRPGHPVGQHGPGILGGLFHGIGHALGSLFHGVTDVAKISAAVATGNTTALTNAILGMIGGNRAGGATADMASMLLGMGRTAIGDVVKWLIGHGGGGADGNAIVKFAMSYLGKIPYTWGGTSLTGDDCSGFVEDVYNHFGIHPPRTSEAQGAWVKRSGPVPGGLAFYVSSGGGPPPGHVAIVRSPTQVISQGGPEGVKGPTLMPLHGMPLMFTGIPPGGLGGVGLGPQNLRQIEGYWMQAGGPGGMIAHIAAAITGAEAGFRPGAVQQGQPYATTGWGLWQITPGNSEPQFGINQALLNPLNNARAAVAKWRGAGDSFSPWTTYMSGAYQRFMDGGGWLMPGLNLNANATGQPEAVLNPQQSAAFVRFAEAAHRLSGGAGATAHGGMMRDVYLSLPEGSTVAQALSELGWALRTSRQQAWTGVPG